MVGSLASKCPLFTSEQKGDDPQTLNPAFGLRCFGKDKINRCKQREGTQPDIFVIALIATDFIRIRNRWTVFTCGGNCLNSGLFIVRQGMHGILLKRNQCPILVKLRFNQRWLSLAIFFFFRIKLRGGGDCPKTQLRSSFFDRD